MDIATNIKKLRKSKGYTQTDLAKLLNVKPTAISAWEVGRNKPLMDKISLMENIFNVSFTDIMGDTKEIEDINKIYNQLNAIRKQKVCNFATQQLNEQNKVINIANYKTTEIAVYGAVSAGRGEYLGTTNPEMVTIEGTAPEHDYAVRVNGDSMEPLFQNGQFIFVKKVDGDDEVRSNQIVIATFNGDAYVKKFVTDPVNKKCKLVSLNQEYADIEIHPYDEFDIIGIVIL